MKANMISRTARVVGLAGLTAVLALLLTSCSTPGRRLSGSFENSSSADGGAAAGDVAAARPGADPAYVGFPWVESRPAVGASTAPDSLGWQHYRLPGKQATAYAFSPIDQRLALSATAVSSASILRQNVRAAPETLGKIRFSWKVPALIRGADLTVREAHDSPVRVALAFEGDRSRFSMKNAMLSELALALTGEALPYATLMYVWCNQCTRGGVLVNPRTDRIREIVLESGPEHLGQWQDYERDIRADFALAFGEAPGALVHVGLMTDTDNTRESTTAWYGPISLTP
jgi:Protein of unknown function (DUF3047)